MRSTDSLLDQYWRAQAQLSGRVAVESLAQWQRVNPLSLQSSGMAWLAFMLSLIGFERRRSRSLAAAFYRLHRAMETGRTVPPLAGDYHPDSVTIGDLRNDWAQLTGIIRMPSRDDYDEIPVDDFEWPEEPTEDHNRAASIALNATGPARVQQQRDRLDDEDFLAELEDLMESAGNTSAGAADREVLRGGRDLINRASQADKRVVGWARVTDGDPCSFCAMLASRGAIYKSRASAGIKDLDGADLPDVHRDDLEKYHNMCHCQTVPIYSRNDFLTPEAREYSRQWREVTKGKAGDEARRAWRHHIDAQRRK